jgi:phage anti-repressor protein
MEQVVKLEIVNFQELVSKNDNLSINFKSKLVDRLDKYFTDNDRRWYVANLFVYLNYHPTNDYPIDLDDIYKVVGFANKGNAKRTLENNFTKDEDYKVVILPTEKNSHGGRPIEIIKLNVDTFKNLCMLAKTDKGKEIRKYYIKLENIFNDLVNEQRLEYETQLRDTQQLLQEKEKVIEELKKQPEMTLYIGHNPGLKNEYKIGITENAHTREESHRSSNPNFVFVFQYKTQNAKHIETMIKLLLKPYKMTKPEWFIITYDQMKSVFDFAVLMYDTYFIHENTVHLNEFVSRYNANRLVHSNKARSLLEHNLYDEYISDCVVVKPGKVTCTLMCEDLYEWLSEKYPEKAATSHLKLNTGNWSTEFQKEFMNYIAKTLNVEYKKINLIDKRRNYNFNNVSGFVGIELKSMSKEIEFFQDVVYKEYADEYLKTTHNSKNKVARVEILEHFHTWIKSKAYVAKHSIYGKKELSTVFKDTFIRKISKLTQSEFVEGICKRKHQGCFVGLVHKEFCCDGNESPELDKPSQKEIREKLIDSWINPDNNDNIAKLYRLALQNNNKVTFVDVKTIFRQKYNFDITANKRRTNWHLVFEKHDDEKCFVIKNV